MLFCSAGCGPKQRQECNVIDLNNQQICFLDREIEDGGAVKREYVRVGTASFYMPLLCSLDAHRAGYYNHVGPSGPFLREKRRGFYMSLQRERSRLKP